ncbi:bifunctional 3-phenylpropionate/cinnamic acid dioxygenase ferredoxin subunit [Jatrophihabitans sp.]|uniref:bifunctional 3-phenylpropionate/cinnamic acid dioxygenase ferredoxin subunit n=1 Tax=Jatrophihabitans sp. TaxID=1932789 RepID=UPI002BC0E829|nr:bifunctional 3-phenylpropionate/cinnamic acid dioxygenase ferredoxin subunit [Jatrophihabitans sp.]
MIRVCALADLPPGEMLRLKGKPPIAVVHTEDGQVFAVDDTCTHEKASLSEGLLEGCFVECFLHNARFDLRTGEPDEDGPADRPLRTHQVAVVDGDIYLTGAPAARSDQPRAS